MMAEMKGVPGVVPERLHEAFTVRHCALSLVGEPIMYPRINEMLRCLHTRLISSFMVTNAQFPERIEQLDPVTQVRLIFICADYKCASLYRRPYIYPTNINPNPNPYPNPNPNPNPDDKAKDKAVGQSPVKSPPRGLAARLSMGSQERRKVALQRREASAAVNSAPSSSATRASVDKDKGDRPGAKAKMSARTPVPHPTPNPASNPIPPIPNPNLHLASTPTVSSPASSARSENSDTTFSAEKITPSGSNPHPSQSKSSFGASDDSSAERPAARGLQYFAGSPPVQPDLSDTPESTQSRKSISSANGVPTPPGSSSPAPLWLWRSATPNFTSANTSASTSALSPALSGKLYLFIAHDNPQVRNTV